MDKRNQAAKKKIPCLGKYWPGVIVLILLAAGIFCFLQPSPVSASVSNIPNDNVWITNGAVYSMARAGNTIYLGGGFTQVCPNTGTGAPISAATGSSTSPFPKVDGVIYAAISDGSNGWYIGGTFTKVGTTTRNYIAHILSNGTVDPTWNPNANGYINTLALNSSGTIVYAGGIFTSIGGQSRSRIAALDANSGTSTDWNPDAYGTVYSLAINPIDGTVYAGGEFTSIGSSTRHFIAAINATSGLATAWNPNSNHYVYALAVNSSGTTVYAGGYFNGVNSIGSSTRNYIAAINATSGLATAWNPNANNRVRTIALAPDGTVYAGGEFTTISVWTRNRIAAINGSTGAATAWNPNASGTYVSALAFDSTHNLVYAGGDFTTIGGQPRNRIAAINGSTGAATAWNPNANNAVSALALNPSKTLVYAGGWFTGINCQDRNNVAAINGSTGAATAWNPNANGTYVYDLAFDSTNNLVYASGNFTAIGGQNRNHIAAINATSGVATGWNPNASGTYVYALAFDSTNNLVYASGDFTSIGGQDRNQIAAINATSGVATGWNPNTNSLVFGFALNSSNTLVYVGGSFTTIGGQPRKYIAALDATTGSATDWNPGASIGTGTYVYTLAVNSSDTTVYAGGNFTTIGGQPRKYIAALDATTGSSTDWNPNASGTYVSALAFDSTNNLVYASGYFTAIGGQPRNNLAALDATTGSSTPWNPNVNGPVYYHHNFNLDSINNHVYIGGGFTIIGGNLFPYFAQFDILGLTVTPTIGTTTEAAGPNKLFVFSVVLTSQPSSTVQIISTSSDVSEGVVTSGNILTFTTSSWAAAQFVTTTGVDDTLAGSNVQYNINLNASSTDSNYNGMTSTVALVNIDDDYPGFFITPISGNTTEMGGTATSTIRLTSQPTANVTIGISSSDLSEGTVLPTSLTFTTSTWNIPQTITVTGVDDTEVDGNLLYSIVTAAAVSTDINYSGLNSTDTPVVNTDDDTATGAIISNIPDEDVWVTNGQVNSIVKSGDTIYLGGSFSRVGPNTSPSLLIGTSDSSPNYPFPEVNGTINVAIRDGSGGWYVAGDFTQIGILARDRLAHVLSNGAVDTDWDPGANNFIHSLALNSSGTILYVGGDFTTIGGQTRNYIAALYTNGTGTPTDWNPDASGGATEIRNVALNSSGTIVYVGGEFTTIGGQSRNRIAAIYTNGTGTATTWNPGSDGIVNSIAFNSDDTIVYAGGYFSTIGGLSRNKIAALDAATGAATTWNPDANDNVYKVTLNPSKTVVYAGGRFTSIGGQSRNYLAGLDTATGAATTWNPNASNTEAGGFVHAIAINSDNTIIYAGGNFTSIGGQTRDYLAALDAATGAATTWNPDASNPVYTLTLNSDDTQILVGGGFESVGGKARNNIAAIDASTGIATDWNPNADSIIYTLALNSNDTIIYAGGGFTNIGGEARNLIAALDASTGLATTWNPNAIGASITDWGHTSNGLVTDLALNSSNTVFVSGYFYNIGGQPRNNLAAIDASTGLATVWDPNADNYVHAIALNSSGTIAYVGGDFINISSTTRNHIAAIDTNGTGTLTAWDPNVATGTDVYVLALNSDDTLVYVGGPFTNIGGKSRNNLAAIDASTGLATDWNPDASNWVFTIALDSGNDLVYVGGDFTAIGIQTRNRLAAIDVDTGVASPWNPDADSAVYALALNSSNTIAYAGGNFTTIGGDPHPYFAQFNSTYADYTVTPAVLPYIIIDEGEGDVTAWAVVLAGPPADKVVINITSNDAAVTASAASLTFTSSTWDQPQYVYITAPEDIDRDSEVVTVTFDIADLASDPAWRPLAPKTRRVDVIDNDTAGFNILSSYPTAEITEGGTTDSFDVVLTIQPATPVIFDITSSDPTSAIVDHTQLTFIPSEWNVPQTVIISAPQDADVISETPAITIAVNAASDADWIPLAARTVNVAVTDNDTAGFTVTPASSIPMTEGQTRNDAWSVILTAQPTSDVVIEITSNNAAIEIITSTLTFTNDNWNATQTVPIRAINDANAINEFVTTTFAVNSAISDAAWDSLTTTRQVHVMDNDGAGIDVFPDLSVSIIEGATNTAAWDVALEAQPVDDVVIEITSNNAAITINTPFLTFTSSTWNVATFVSITAPEDPNLTSENITVTFAVSSTLSDAAWDSLTTTRQVLVTDIIGTAGFAVTPTSTIIAIDENTTTSTAWAVVLTAQPADDVAIAIFSSNTLAVAINTPPLTFNSSTWNIPQSVSITAPEDPNRDDELNVGIRFVVDDGSSDADWHDVAPLIRYVDVTDNDKAGFTVTPTSTAVTENGATSSFAVVLTIQPTDNVVFTITSSDPTSAIVSTSSITFTAGNWNATQTITVIGVDDPDAVSETPTITVAVNDAASDDEWDPLATTTINVTVHDDDIAATTTIAFAATSSSGNEAVTPVILIVALSAATTSPVTVNYAVTGGTATSSDFTLANGTSTITAGNTTTSIPLTIVNDSNIESDETIIITLSNPVGADLGANTTYTYTILNDDIAATTTIAFVATSSAGSEVLGTVSVIVTLSATSTSDVTFYFELTGGTVTTSDFFLGLTDGSGVIAAGNTTTSASFFFLNDAIVEPDEIAIFTLTSSTNATLGANTTYTYTILNDDAAPGVTVTQSGGSTAIAEGGVTDGYTLVLNSTPTADVIITIAADAQANADTSTIIFTAANWNLPVTVTLTAVDDVFIEGPHFSTTTHSASSGDLNYDSITIDNVVASVIDNDTPGITVMPLIGTTTEAGGTTTYTIVLNNAPSDDVSIGISSSNIDEGTVSTSSLTFTTGNWGTPQTITVTGIDDFVADGNIAYTIINATATSADINYNNLKPADVSVTNIDNDAAGIFVTPLYGTTTEAGGTATYTIKLDSPPTDDVTINISSSDTTEGTVSPSSLTFTSANWSTAQTVTITGVNDSIVDGNIAYTAINATSTSADINYDGLNPRDVSLINTDNDTAGFTVSAISGNTTEAGGTANFTVKLNTQPTANVTIGISSNDTSEGTVSPSSLTFTSANWNTAQTVTVTGVNDSSVDGNIAYAIVLAAASSGDPNYNGLNPSDVSVTNTDNDSGGGGGGGGGGGVTYPTVPTDWITVSPGLTVTSPNVTFTLNITNASLMLVSEDQNFTGMSWENYVTTRAFTLSSGSGTKTVYFKFRSSTGGDSAIKSVAIALTEGEIVPPPPGPLTPDHNFIKLGGSPAIYWLSPDNTRYLFSSRAVFSSWFGDDFNGLHEVSRTEFDAMPFGGNLTVKPGSYIKFDNSPTIYNVQDANNIYPAGYYAGYVIQASFEDNYNINGVAPDRTPIYTQINKNYLVKIKGLSAIYWRSADSKRYLFSSRAVFSSWFGDDFSGLKEISQAEFDALSSGGNITIKPGSYLKFDNSPTVYYVQDANNIYPVAGTPPEYYIQDGFEADYNIASE